MEFTKTDFIHYLNCRKSLWLLKNSPTDYPHGEFSNFMKKLIREGHEVELYVRQFFNDSSDRVVEFQKHFETDGKLVARVDAIEHTRDDEIILYEIKSSTSVKTDTQHNHVKDACFQKICAERTGQRIDRVFLVHLNRSYVREGDVEPNALLTFSDITKQVEAIAIETDREINEALEFLQSSIDMNGCDCIEKSRSYHCDTFSRFNPDIPTPSIYSLPRLSTSKRRKLLSKNILRLEDIEDTFPLSQNQRLIVQAAKNGGPQINPREIARFLSELRFPLYFLDYETFSSAVPLIDGGSPHKNFPVQYSLHILNEDGSLIHKEYLERVPRMPCRLIEQMQDEIGPTGSIVSWHASFEKTQNQEMAKGFPEHATFLRNSNERMVDLEVVFKTGYVDSRFDGSTSIKKVLPVICPNLDYNELDVQDGVSAMEAWKQMVSTEPEEAESIARALLNYCERDTLAMVEIYRFLTRI